MDTGGSHVEAPVVAQGRSCWQVPFWRPPSSLLARGLSHAHQPVGIRTGKPQAKPLGEHGHSSTTSRPAALGPSEPQPTRTWPATRAPRRLLQPPVWANKPRDPPPCSQLSRPCPTHQQADTNFSNPRARQPETLGPGLPTSRLAPLPARQAL